MPQVCKSQARQREARVRMRMYRCQMFKSPAQLTCKRKDVPTPRPHPKTLRGAHSREVPVVTLLQPLHHRVAAGGQPAGDLGGQGTARSCLHSMSDVGMLGAAMALDEAPTPLTTCPHGHFPASPTSQCGGCVACRSWPLPVASLTRNPWPSSNWEGRTEGYGSDD